MEWSATAELERGFALDAVVIDVPFPSRPTTKTRQTARQLKRTSNWSATRCADHLEQTWHFSLYASERIVGLHATLSWQRPHHPQR
jgi:hypothetical protein